MKKNKKGTDVGASMPKRNGERYCLSRLAQSHLNMILKICLFLISAALILIYLGAYLDNELISIFGLGVGAAGGIIQAKINTEDE